MLITPAKITRLLIFVLIMFRVSGAMAVGQEGPHRLWGELSSTYSDTDTGSDRSDSSSWINTATIAGSSYIWRPWFALVNGGLSLSIAESDTTGQPTTTNEFITGNGRLDLFPRSRFPFSAYYIEGRNRFDDTVFRADAETTEYGATQSYRSLDGRQNYSAEYENNQSDSDDRNDFQSENLTISALNRLGDNLFDSEISFETVDNTTTGQQIDRYGLIVDHSFEDTRDFTIDNLLSTFTTENDFFDFNSEVETTQLSSYATWRPRGNKDLRLTGSVRLNETRVDDQTRAPVLSQRFESETTSTNVSQGLIYQYSNNLQLSESVSATSTEFDGDDVTIANESLSARYLSDPIFTDYGDYAWNASTAFDNLHGDIESRQALNNQFGHALMKTYARQNRYQLQTNLTQSFSYIYLTENSDEKIVDHSYSMTWTDASIQTQNTIRFFISDSRTLNEDKDYFQVLDLQYTGTNRLNRYSQLSGNMSLQFSRQKFERLQSEETSVNGQLAYRRIRVFQVPGLTFFSELHASRLEFDREQVTETIDTDTNVLWENTLLYNIGRLEVSVELDYVKVRDEYDQLFRFEITRSFGDL